MTHKTIVSSLASVLLRAPLLALLLVGLLSSGLVLAATGDPRQCPRAVGQAIDAADVAAFTRLVDVDGIVEEGVILFLAEMQKPENARQLPPMLAMMFTRAASGDDMGQSIRTMLIGETKAFILNGVSSGAFAGRAPTGATQQGLLAPLFAEASRGRKEIRSIGQPTAIGEGLWHVPFVVHDGGNGHDYPVVGLVSRTDSGLRLTAIDNLAELFRRIAAESQSIQQ